jgi:hypothetical protein
MRRTTVVAAAGIAVLTLSLASCKSSTKSSAASTSSPVVVATQTQADSPDAASTSSQPSAATSQSTSASASPVAASSSAPAAAKPAAAGDIDACSLMTGAEASSLTGRSYGAGVSKMIAPGQDQCTYPYSGPSVDLVVIIYQPNSGVSLDIMRSVLSGVGTVADVPGVGDKAIFAGIELDVATGQRLIAVQGADALNSDTGAIAIAKHLVSELSS